MKSYAGLDVSLREISVCVISEEGRIIARGKVPCEPQAVAIWFRQQALEPELVVHETGQMAIWLQRGLIAAGLKAVCIDARKAHKSLSARLNKTDASDAEGLAQLARTGWFTPVHVRHEDCDQLRSLVAARDRLIRLRKDLEGHVRGMLKTFGIRMTGVSPGGQRQAFREQLAAAAEADPMLAAVADGFVTVHATLCKASDDLERALCQSASDSDPLSASKFDPLRIWPRWPSARDGCSEGGARRRVALK